MQRITEEDACLAVGNTSGARDNSTQNLWTKYHIYKREDTLERPQIRRISF